MGALIGIAIQLAMFAIRLMILLVMLTVRLTIMLIAAAVGAVSAKRR